MNRLYSALLALSITCLSIGGQVDASMTLTGIGGGGTPVSNLVMPLFSSFTAVTGSANEFGGQVAAQNIAGFGTSSTSGRYAMPFAGSVGNLFASFNNATLTGTGAIVDNINGTNKTVTCTFSSPQCTPSGSPSDSFNQGDLFQWALVANGDTWQQTSVGRIGYTITAANGQHGLFFAAGGGGTTGSAFMPIGSRLTGGGTSATELSVSAISPTGFTLNGIWAWTGGVATGGTTQTLTVCKNNSVTACTSGAGVFVTLPISSAAGACGTNAASGIINVSTACTQTNLTPVHFSAGDTVSIQSNCPGTCSNTFMFITLDFTPDSAGEVPIFAGTSSIATNSAIWAGVSDSIFLNASGQVSYQVVPNVTGHVTFSKMISCTTVNPGGAASRPFTLQSGANATTVPTTGSGPVATMSVANGACPGANSGTLLAGNQPATTLSLTAGQTLDTVTTGVGSPASPGASKVSYVAKVGP